MKMISKVKPSHGKTRLRLRPWVKKSIKGICLIIVGVSIMNLFTNNADSKVLKEDLVVDNYVVQASNGVKSEELAYNDFEEEVVEEHEEVVERVNYSCSSSSVKTYMDYRAITDKSSNQYKYIQNHMTVGDDGFLYDEDGSIGVALGSHFGSIGSKWEIVLDTGITFKVVKIDEKADIHVYNGCQHKEDGSVVEFVIDSHKFEKASNGYVWQGNFNNNPNFRGKISAVYKVD